MKTMFISIVICVAVWVISAQTITTNWSMTAPNIRKVGDKFYNVDQSQAFTTFGGDCIQVMNDGIVVHDVTLAPVYSRGHGDGNMLTAQAPTLLGNRVVSEKDIFILNFPTNLQAAVGVRESGRAMKIGTTNLNGQVIELYDFGRRGIYQIISTNPSPEMTTNIATRIKPSGSLEKQ